LQLHLIITLNVIVVRSTESSILKKLALKNYFELPSAKIHPNIFPKQKSREKANVLESPSTLLFQSIDAFSFQSWPSKWLSGHFRQAMEASSS
jgi:hypothetical protein